jgi:phage tail protein X
MSRYNNNVNTQPAKLDLENKRRYYDSLLDPVIERRDDDIYVITSIGERLDLLAWKYYSDVDLWWIIAAANPELRKDSLYLEPGSQIRVPIDYFNALELLETQNIFR